MDELGGLFGILFIFGLVIAIIILILYAIAAIVGVILAVAAIYGFFKTIKNYIAAFQDVMGIEQKQTIEGEEE